MYVHTNKRWVEIKFVSFDDEWFMLISTERSKI